MKTMLLLLIAASLVGAVACPAEAYELRSRQTGSIGYSPGIPGQLFGMSLFGTSPEGVNLYLDFRGDVTQEPEGYYSDLHVEEANAWEHALLSEEDSWMSANIGVTRVLTNWLALYAAAGWAGNTPRRNHFDDDGVLGKDGDYWINAPWEHHVNGAAGLLLFTDIGVGLQVGYETAPESVVAGLFFTLWGSGIWDARLPGEER